MLLDRAVRKRSLQELEGIDWGAPCADYPSGLVEDCLQGRKIPLEALDPRAIKRMIGQEIGLKWLIPLALERLLVDPWVDTDSVGLLIEAVLRLPEAYWQEHPSLSEAWSRTIERALLEAAGARGKRALRFDSEVIRQLEELRRGRAVRFRR